MPPKKKSTRERDARICSDYKQGLPQWALLNKYGITWASILVILKEGNVELRWRHFPKMQKALNANKQTVKAELAMIEKDKKK